MNFLNKKTRIFLVLACSVCTVCCVPLSPPKDINRNRTFLKDVKESLGTDAGTYTHVFGINVGQGAFFVERTGKEIVIIDAGTTKSEKIDESKLRDDLIKAGRRGELLTSILDGCTIKEIFITHGDVDHYNTMEIFLESIGSIQDAKIDENLVIFVGGSLNNTKNSVKVCMKGIRKYEKIRSSEKITPQVYVYDNSKDKGSRVFKSTGENVSVSLDSISANAKFLQCDGNNPGKDKNSFSLIFALHKMIYTGDAIENTCSEKDVGDLAFRGGIIVGSVLPHHGSSTEGSDKVGQLVVKVPKVLFGVVPVGTDSKFKHPDLVGMFGINGDDISNWDAWRNYPSLARVPPHNITFKKGGKMVQEVIPVAIYETSMPQGISAQCFKLNETEVWVYDHNKLASADSYNGNWLRLQTPASVSAPAPRQKKKHRSQS